MSASLQDSAPLRLRGIKSLKAIHPRQTARNIRTINAHYTQDLT